MERPVQGHQEPLLRRRWVPVNEKEEVRLPATLVTLL